MTLRLFNTLSGKLDEFKPQNLPEVRMYTCGPTVYDFAHIGNFRTFIFQDLLKRYLTYKGFKVRHVMNVTDVDDKTIAGALREKKSLKEFTKKYTDAFFEDLKILGIQPADEVLFATDTIPSMVEMIKTLVAKDHAYEKDGSVYFRVASFKEYGKLSKKKLEANVTQERVLSDEYDKEEGADFALWKKAKEEDIQVGAVWDSPWGKGRPGWHIECSTMSLKAFNNETLDIHAGGEDLIFPHHENEIAQSESCTGKKFVNYWLHTRHLLVDGKKMSKKDKNFYTLRDLLKKGFNPLAIRYLLFSTHYRSQLNFTLDGLSAAKESIKRVYDFCYDARKNYNWPNKEDRAGHAIVREARVGFENVMDDDLNISAGLAFIFDAIKKVNLLKDPKEKMFAAFDLENVIRSIDQVLGVFDFGKEVLLPPEVQKLQQEYAQAKAKKDYKKVDELREKNKKLGYRFEDTPQGVRVKKII